MTYQLIQSGFPLSNIQSCLRRDAITGRPVVLLEVFAKSSAITRRAVRMRRFSISSWFATKSNGEVAGDVECKKQARRSPSSCFASASPLRSNINRCGSIHKTLSNEKGSGINCNVDRRSVSTLKSVSDVTSDTVNTPASSTSDMVALSRKIAEETEKLEEYMKANSLAMPGFDVDAADDFPKLPGEIQRSRLEIIHATKELRDLAVGPRESVRWGVWEVSSSCLNTTTSCLILYSRNFYSSLTSWRFK